MSFFLYFVCALLGVDSLRGGFAKGNRIFLWAFGRSNLVPTTVANQNGVILEVGVWGGGGWLPVTMSQLDVTPGFFSGFR